MCDLNSNPIVSIIIPVHNGEVYMRKCLDALIKQDYPKDGYEVIVVDNGSSDRTPEIVREYEGVVLLFERNIQSSYAARNRGIERAIGDILAFTDADCTPNDNWVSEGIRCITGVGADLVGGRVRFIYSNRQTATELFDSFVNMQNRQCINERAVAKTANLFVSKHVFSKIGLFPSSVKSGGDIIFTDKASKSGLKLVYCDKAVVWHPARKFRGLARKSYRTGRGKANINDKTGLQFGIARTLAGTVMQFFRFVKPTHFAERVREENIEAGIFKIARISFIKYVMDVIYGFGGLVGAVSLRIGKR